VLDLLSRHYVPLRHPPEEVQVKFQDNVDLNSMDWVTFCEDHGIPFVERGPNVARGHVGVACPLCGDDPSHHLGLNMNDSRWGCWRDQSHRGRSPVYLIQAFLNTDKKSAIAVAKRYCKDMAVEHGAIRQRLDRVARESGVVKRAERAEIDDAMAPADTFPVTKNPKAGAPAIQYLRQRGFNVQTELVCRRYNVRYASKGQASGRVWFPVRSGGGVKGYVGRTIVGHKARYYAHPGGDALKTTIWNYDRCLDAPDKPLGSTPGGFKGNKTALSDPPPGKVLIICEGILDAMKLDFYGSPHGVRSCALLGLSLGKEKQVMLAHLARKYHKVYICLDAEAQRNAYEMESKLALARARVLPLPEGVEDPGAMSPKEASAFCRDAAR
jgi:hypothetical protein